MPTDYLKMAAMNWWRVGDIVDALFEDSLTKQDIFNCQADRVFNKKSRSLKHKKYRVYEDVLEIMQDSILNDPIFRHLGAYEINSLRYNKENSADWQLGPRATIEILESKIIPYMKAKGVEPSMGMAKMIQVMRAELTARTQQAKTENNARTGIQGGEWRGRPKFPHEEAVARVIKKICKNKHCPPKKEMPFHLDVVEAFAPGQGIHIAVDMSKAEYKKITKWGYSTIYNLVNKHYKKTTPQKLD